MCRLRKYLQIGFSVAWRRSPRGFITANEQVEVIFLGRDAVAKDLINRVLRTVGQYFELGWLLVKHGRVRLWRLLCYAV